MPFFSRLFCLPISFQITRQIANIKRYQLRMLQYDLLHNFIDPFRFGWFVGWFPRVELYCMDNIIDYFMVSSYQSVCKTARNRRLAYCSKLSNCQYATANKPLQ